MPVYTSINPIDDLFLPAIYAGEPSSSSVVIILHGLGVSKEVQIPELQRLKAEGFFSVAIDAPHHGERVDGYLEVMEKQTCDLSKHLMLIKIICQQAVEVEALINYYQNHGKKVAVVGISMGGFSTFALLRGHCKPDLCAPFLASPDFRLPEAGKDFPESIIEKSGPFDFPEEAFPTPLFVVNGLLDTVVKASQSESFYGKLQKLYAKKPELLEFHAYPKSEHFMKPADWYDSWSKLIKKLQALDF